ncbi:MAG TPA: hypothetical protein VK613_08580 [Gaiellaceae bacterium]|nr:hypothetical protein [Gaiellaceae bacterium]
MSLTYELVLRTPTGKQRVQQYASDEPLAPGEVVQLRGRFWLVESLDAEQESGLPRAIAKPARYRLRLRHPDEREELGAFRRFRPGSPRLGHAFTTLEAGQPISWQVVEEQLRRDDDGEPFLDLIAERDYAEAEGDLPDHQLEHALERERDEGLPAGAEATIARAAEQGLDVELVALEPGEEPDWPESLRYVDALIFEEIEDDLFEQCGVDLDVDPRETWLSIVKQRLREDLEAFRNDIEAGHDEIEEWDFRGGRIFVSVGTYEEEFDPVSGHGWMCRLVDSGVLGVAGFERVRKYELQVESAD